MWRGRSHCGDLSTSPSVRPGTPEFELRFLQLTHRFGRLLYGMPVPLLAAVQTLSIKQADYIYHARNMDAKALFHMARY